MKFQVGRLVIGMLAVAVAAHVLRNRELVRKRGKRRRTDSLVLQEPVATIGEEESITQGEVQRGELKSFTQGEFVLLAAFDGIRGCSVALRMLGIEPLMDYSSEVDASCRRLIAAKFPNCVQLGDIRKLDKAVLANLVEKHGTGVPWLVVGGSPCQDLSAATVRGPSAIGLTGKRSKLFFEFVRVLNALVSFGVQVAFILENVASMADGDRDSISACLGVDPVDIDSALVSACHRRRYYWTNIPVTPIVQQRVDVDSLLDEGWYHVTGAKPFPCFVASAASPGRRHRGDNNLVRREIDGTEREPNADERERILGFPQGHTRLQDEQGRDSFTESLRLKLLGNSFSVPVVAHILAPIAAYVRDGSPLELQSLREDAKVLTMNRSWNECDSTEGGRSATLESEEPWALEF